MRILWSSIKGSGMLLVADITLDLYKVAHIPVPFSTCWAWIQRSSEIFLRRFGGGSLLLGGGEGEQGVSLVSRLMNQRQLDAAVAAAKDEAEGGSLSNEAWGGGSS